jgi:N-acetylglucosaminyldiphosphoundecaprenol N-acetyl-beta-D-mannosaminyltransferase
MLLKVPLDIAPPEELPSIISSLQRLKEQGDISGNGLDIVLLSLWDLLKARRNKEYRNYIFNAALIIPISKSIVGGAKFLTGKTVFRYMPFKFVISLLTMLEKQGHSVYLYGSENKVLKKAEKNIHATFPHLKIVGRCEGAIRRNEEPAVIEAIRKASPSLLLAGKGIRGEELWITRNSGRLNAGFRLWCSDLFDIFAEKRQRPSDAVFEKGLESIVYCFRNPLKLFRVVFYMRYLILLLFSRLFKST